MIFAPNRENIRCHLFPLPALALAGSSSCTWTPYCLMQHVKALFLGTRVMSVFGSPSPSTIFMLVPALEPRSFKTVAFDLCVDDLEAMLSFSLSLSSGMSPAFRRGGEAENSVPKDDGGAMLFSFVDFRAIMAVFCSSRS